MLLSVCVHAHSQAKRPATSKFGTEMLEWSFEKSFLRNTVINLRENAILTTSVQKERKSVKQLKMSQ